MIVLLLPLLVGLILLGAMFGAARWFANANASALARKVRTGGHMGLILVGLLMVLRGQVAVGLGLIASGMGKMRGQGGQPFGQNGPFGAGGPFGPGGPFGSGNPFGPGGSFGNGGPFGGAGPFGPFGGPRRRRGRPSAGQASTVRTATLEASLDHDTGEMDARVLRGRFRDRTFASLTKADLLDLWREFRCSGEEDSRLLVEAYLDRRHAEWRDDVEADADPGTRGAHGAGRAGSGALSEHEAYEILGLEPGAGEAQIRAAHRRLMKQMHPDQGGSTFLAARLNEAKDVLLGRR